MKTIKLYGHLGKKFGKIHKYSVRTPAEAIRALCANFPEFKQHLLQYNSPGYHVLSGIEDCVEPKEKLHYPVTDTIKIIPAITGAGGGWGNIILGAALIAVAWWNPMGWGVIANSAGGLLAGELAITAMGYVGTALLLGGVSQLLFKPPSQSIMNAAEVEQNASAYFNGPQNVSTQGNPVPVVYGRLMVGSQVISAELTASKFLVAPVARTSGTEIWLINIVDPSLSGKYTTTVSEPYKKGDIVSTTSSNDKFTSVLVPQTNTQLAYIKAGFSGTDLDGKVVGFKIKAAPSIGQLKLENADGSVFDISTNVQYSTREVSTDLGNTTTEDAYRMTFSSIFRAHNSTSSTPSTGAIIRWYPPSGTWTGTTSFTYVVVDDDGVESLPAIVNLGYTG